MRDLSTDAIALRVASLELDSPADQVREAILLVDALEKTTRTLARNLDASVIAWLDANGGSIEIGDVRYYVGRDKRVKCRDVRRTLESLLDATGGAIDEVCRCLSSNALLPAQVKQRLGETVYHEHFSEEIVPDLTTGKPRRVVKSVNPQWVKGAA